MQRRSTQACLRLPGPPFLIIFRQLTHLSQLGALQPLQLPHRRILFFLEIPVERIPLDTASWSIENVPTPRGDSDFTSFEGHDCVTETSPFLQHSSV